MTPTRKVQGIPYYPRPRLINIDTETRLDVLRRLLHEVYESNAAVKAQLEGYLVKARPGDEMPMEAPPAPGNPELLAMMRLLDTVPGIETGDEAAAREAAHNTTTNKEDK